MYHILKKYFTSITIETVLLKYDESWRFFHNRKHLEYIIEKFNSLKINISDDEIDIFYLTTLFHDVVYKPWSNTNEEDSVEVFKDYWNNYSLSDNKNIYNSVIQNILDTKTHDVRNVFNRFDMYIVLEETDTNKILEWENNIFKEYSFVPYKTYKEGRLKLLNSWIIQNDSLKFLKEYIESRIPKVGFYAGSFNPFHVGHLNILKQASEIYDKVVILIGQNATKAPITEFEAKNRKLEIFNKTGLEVEFFDGLLPEYLKTRVDENVFLIRGIRNEEDLKNELVQSRYMKSIWSDLKIQYLTCPVELNFISSSGIKAMNNAKEGSGDMFIPKNLF